MKKISMKQLLVNAMEEYGNTLILSDRFWSRTTIALSRLILIEIKNKLNFGGTILWRPILWRIWPSLWPSTASFWTASVSDRNIPERIHAIAGGMKNENQYDLWRNAEESGKAS